MNIFYISEDPIQAAKWMVDRHVVKMILESAQLLSTAHRVLDGEKIVTITQPTMLDELIGDILKNDGYKKPRKKTIWKLHDSRDSVIYSATHINHPSARWCRSSVENYNWLVEHFFALMKEYTYRYGKQHKCSGEISYRLQSPPNNLKEIAFTKIPCAMAEEFIISEDPVENYRNYYKVGKKHLHKYTNREQPEWLYE